MMRPALLALSPLALLLLALVLLAHPALAGDDNTGKEIDHLLRHVAQSGCTFTRNGDTHDAADAADHLRLKYSRGSRWVDTAEDFIDRLASASSWTGEPYTITCDGQTEPTGPWLHRALKAYRAPGPQTGP